MPSRVLVRCPECSKERSILKTNLGKMKSKDCHSCCNRKKMIKNNKTMVRARGHESSQWKRGYTLSSGYRVANIHPGHDFYDMADKYGRIRLHRLIMARHIGRMLSPTEVVHHIDGDKQNNQISNLQLLCSRAEHLPYIFAQKEGSHAGFSYEDFGW